MNETNFTELLKRAATANEEGLLLFFPIGADGAIDVSAAYTALNPRNPEDIALLIEAKAFDPTVDEEDIPCDEDGEPIFWRWVNFVL
jgi:hypothetical protein